MFQMDQSKTQADEVPDVIDGPNALRGDPRKEERYVL
jgi:hypothetical protein